MFDPNTLYNNNPRKKSIVEYDKVLSIPGAEKIAQQLMIQWCHELYKKTNKTVTYIEVGVWLGGTFNNIMQKCKDISIKGIGIDLFEDFQVINDGNTHYGDVANKDDIDKKLRENGLSNFELIKGDTIEVINTFESMENVVCFIDANHTYEAVKADFYAILPKIKNGYIVFDDLDWISIFQFFNEIQYNFPIAFRNRRTGAIRID